MRFDTRNISLINAHGFKPNTSKVRPVPALASGVCVFCADEVMPGQPICWDRARGIFHARCFEQLGQARPALDPDEVRKLVERIVGDKSGESFDIEMIEKLIDEKIAERQGVTVHVVRPDDTKYTVDNAHADFRKLLFFISRGQHVYLYGPPGSGKSTGAKMVSDALGRDYGYISLNPQTPDSRLLGYMDANGRYVETVFFKLYRDGGVFCIDEMDNASASLLTTLNSALENQHGAFPCGVIPRHPEFIVVATGNTTGRGGNPQFPERRVFDAAFAERFAYLHWGYDERLERSLALQINPKAEPWIKWVQAVRAFGAQHDPRLVVSPRASFKIADYLNHNVLSPREIVDAALFKGIEEQRITRILTALPMPEVA